VKLPSLTADQASDVLHVVAIGYAVGLAVRSVVWKAPPTLTDIGLIGTLLGGAVANSKYNGTPGA